ncbi:MAG TPA: AAA family ATPase [Bacteroidales bacterium]|nr:AAA family ATPase [Bacteroidales bacterium]
MIDRQIIGELRKWSQRKNRKPLILRGARQVGKTTIVNEFAKEYSVYLRLNLEKETDKNLFERYDTINELVIAIHLHNAKKIENLPTLLFIDEIQNSPKAVAMLRYFYEEANHIHVIAAGSLLESLLNTQHLSFPVGRVEYLAMRPCSFLEFLNGIGETFDADLIRSLQVEAVHERVMKHFNSYALVGGMPAAIVQYAENRDILSVATIYESLIESYKDDAEKYALNDTTVKVVRHILQVGWAYAAETISFEKFGGSPYKSREMGAAFRLIEKALLFELVYPTSETRLPILSDFNKKPKLIWLDTGLVNYASKVQQEVFSVVNIQDAWRGKIAEQIVAQELLSLSSMVSTKRNFWRRDKAGSNAEVDFLFIYKGMIIPIEVKSGHNARLKSLHLYMDQTTHQVAVRIWSNALSVDIVKTPNGKTFKLINIPFYYLGVLELVLDKFSDL